MKTRQITTVKTLMCLDTFWHHLSPVLVLVVLSLALQPHRIWAAPGRSFPSMPFLPSSPSSSSLSSLSMSGSPYLSSTSSLSSPGLSMLSRRSVSSESEQLTDPISRLSKVFGVSRIPHRVFRRSPPQYMQDLYASITVTGGLSRTSGPYNSNVIRSFPDKDSVHRMHFQYNISYLEDEEKILEAEFHLFKMRPGPATGGEQRLPHVILIKVYQVLDIEDMTSPENIRLLDARRVNTHGHGWYVFNVTRAVLSWHYETATNYGFLVTAETASGTHVNGSQLRFAQRNEHHDSKQPILVLFTDTGTPRHSKYISPNDENYLQIQETILRREEEKKNQRQTANFQDAIRMLNERERRNRSSRRTKRSTGKNRSKGGRRKRTYENMYRYRNRRSCSKYEMFVDFEEIGWSGWIISPNSYNAFHCSGECPFPLGQSQKPTNHATVQSIVHALGVGKDVGTPCCVPSELYSISLLYFDDNENVILKQYDDMVVAKCGCH